MYSEGKPGRFWCTSLRCRCAFAGLLMPDPREQDKAGRAVHLQKKRTAPLTEDLQLNVGLNSNTPVWCAAIARCHSSRVGEGENWKLSPF